MSFIPINEENKEAPQGQTTNAPITSAPPQTSGSAGSAPSAPKTASTGTPTQFGSSASKLGDYLSANAPQIGQQAETLAGNLNQQYGNVSQGITNAAKEFGQQVQGGYAAANPDLILQAIQNPADFASNPTNVQGFQSQYNDTYTGPSTFEGTSPYSDIQNQVGQAVQQGNLLGTESGLQSYLQGQGANPSRASATLDALLLRGNPEAQATIRNAANQLGGLGGELQTATTGADQSVLAAQKAAQDAAAYAQGQFNPYVQNFGTALNTNLANTKNTYTNQLAAQNAVQAALNNNDVLTPEQLAAVGADPAVYNTMLARMNQYQSIYGSSPVGSLGNYLTQGTPATGGLPTLATASTPQDYATAQALATLLGQGYNNPLDPTMAVQAGTALQGYKPGAFDVAKARGDVKNQFISADKDTWASYWPPGTVRSGDPYHGMPTNVYQAASRLNQGGVLDTTFGKYPYVGTFNSNPDLY